MEKKQEFWGSQAAGFFFLAALGAMMFVVIAVMDLVGVELAGLIGGWVSLAALVLTGIGSLLLMSELSDKTKFYLVTSRPSSIMSLGSLIQSVCMVFMFIYATFFFAFIPWSGMIGLQEIVAILGIIAALCLVVYPALELGEARGRAFWNASGLVPLFLASGATSGIAGVIVMAVVLGQAQVPVVHTLDGILFAFLILQTILVAGYLLGMKGSGAEEARRAVEIILHGAFLVSFWGCMIIVGTIIPVILYVFGSMPALLVIKAILILIGCLCFRNVFLKAAVRKTLPGEERSWMSEAAKAVLALQLEQRWKEKQAWLNGGR